MSEQLDFSLASAPPSSSPVASPAPPASPAAQSPAAAPAVPSAAKPVRSPLANEPSEPSADRVKIGDNEFTPAQLQELAQHKAAEDVRKASLPASPDKYELKLSDDFKAPEGVTFKFATDDPVLGGVIQQAREFAHRNNFSQEQFSGMMDLYAASMSREQSFFAEARAAEVRKLGVNGPARVDAVTNWLKAHLGDDLARPQLATLATERHVAGWEKLIQKFSSQGASNFSQQHRSAPDTTKIPGYENMTYDQRRYAQDQRNRR
jgi:hypothetical protein